jgi:hypothetical protein
MLVLMLDGSEELGWGGGMGFSFHDIFSVAYQAERGWGQG